MTNTTAAIGLLTAFLAIDNDNTASIEMEKKCGFKRIAGSDTQGRYYVV